MANKMSKDLKLMFERITKAMRKYKDRVRYLEEFYGIGEKTRVFKKERVEK